MSYPKLLEHCHGLQPSIARNEIKKRTLALVNVPKVPVMMTTLDKKYVRGFYLSAKNTQHKFVQQHGGTVIVLARDLNRCWQRFITIKELMHIFDDPKEATDSGDAFDDLLSGMTAGQNPKDSPQVQSEWRCFWMALALLCPEHARQECISRNNKGEMTHYEIALKFLIPEFYVPHLFDPRYTEILAWLRDGAPNN